MMPLQVRLNILGAANPTGVVLGTPGDSLIVGRDESCDVPIADPGVSSRHFKLTWDGSQCQLIDLVSTNGTRVNDQWVHKAILRNGDEIVAGNSVFKVEICEPPATASAPESADSGSVSSPSETIAQKQSASDSLQEAKTTPSGPVAIFESVEPTLIDQAPVVPEEQSLLEKLTGALMDDEGTSLYAIIDGAQSIELAYIARMMGHNAYTLFAGDMATMVAHAGPCLVVLDRPLPFLGKWVEAIGMNAGILLQSRATLNALYEHLREIFVVQDEQGQEYFFRYYDPRVIRTFLPTCTDQELTEFFGIVNRWIVEDESSKAYVKWGHDHSGLVSATITA